MYMDMPVLGILGAVLILRKICPALILLDRTVPL